MEVEFAALRFPTNSTQDIRKYVDCSSLDGGIFQLIFYLLQYSLLCIFVGCFHIALECY